MNDQRARLAGWLRGAGIEIGALHHRLAVPPGVNVTYVDWKDEAGLRKHYPELDRESFAPVSVIASAEDLSPFGDESLDFVIANHLLEHLEQPIQALKEFQRVLKPGGVLYMALPDRRLTFDKARALTTTEHIFEEQRTGAEANRRAHYLDWASNVDGKQGPEAETRADGLLALRYSIHFHVWTPDSFLDFFVAARREFGLDFQLVGYAAAEVETDNEFILVLARARDEVRLRTNVMPRARSSLQRHLAASPLGPPVRAVKRLLRPTR
jgi:SAM-dependent methyltransferase